MSDKPVIGSVVFSPPFDAREGVGGQAIDLGPLFYAGAAAQQEASAKEIAALRAEVKKAHQSLTWTAAEVERLRGIVQADLEEKAEAWGEVERLTESERSLQAQAELSEAYESRLLAEVERLRTDAERWRFIREHRPKGMSLMPGDELEKLIDKGRAASPTDAQRTESVPLDKG